MKFLSKRTSFLLIASSFVFSVAVNANELKSVSSLQQESSKLEKAIVKAKNITPTLKKMASRDAAFNKAIIADLEKQCGGKAKTDKNCTRKYVQNIKVNVTRLSRSNSAVSNLNKRLNQYRLKEIKKLETLTKNMKNMLPKSIDLINKEFNSNIRLKINTLPAIEKNQLQNDFLNKKNKILNKNHLIKELGMNNDLIGDRNSDLAFKLEDEIKNKLILIMDTLIKPAQAEPITLSTIAIAAAAAAIAGYVNYKISEKQLDKTAICIDESDVSHNRCLRSATSNAVRACRRIGSRFFRGLCETAQRTAKKAVCLAQQGARVTACMLLPQ